jgi:hypothetical protein
MEKLRFVVSNHNENSLLINQYIEGLSCPMDSFMEDRLAESPIFSIYTKDVHVGFAIAKESELIFFYLEKQWISNAQNIFGEFIKCNNIKSVNYQTSDTLLTSLVSDWEYEKVKCAYFFLDSGRIEKPVTSLGAAIFKIASHEDIGLIINETGDFFDEIDQRVINKTIFMLVSEEGELYGCGIIEYSKYFKECASIGMITCKQHRNKGVGQLILWHLKEFCYSKNIKPVAGCWYYNTLSRKTLEKAGMISVARGMQAKLILKEKIVERTGNPPGEIV